MSIVNTLPLESNRQIKINFDGGDLPSDAGLLLIKEFVSKLGVDKLLAKAFKTNDSALFRYHTDQKNLLQMIYMIIAGYFEDDVCTECGTDNEITEANCDDVESYSHNNSNHQTNYTFYNSYTEQCNNKRTKRKQKWKMFLTIIFILLGVCAFGYYEFNKMIPVGYSNEELEGLRYTVVVEKLKESGFTNVKEKEIQDLTISREDEEKMVTDVKLGWMTFFDETTRYPSNLRVTVVYHTVETYSPPLMSKEIKK